jgi:hypothetical protein
MFPDAVAKKEVDMNSYRVFWVSDEGLAVSHSTDRMLPVEGESSEMLRDRLIASINSNPRRTLLSIEEEKSAFASMSEQQAALLAEWQ